MYAQVAKSKDGENQSVADAVAQLRGIDKEGTGFADSRPEAIAQRKLQEMASNHLQTEKPYQLQAVTSELTTARQTIKRVSAKGPSLPALQMQNLEKGAERELTITKPSSNQVVQRALYIDDSAVNGDGETRAAKIKEAFNKHDVHFYYEYNLPAENLESTAKTSFNGKPGVLEMVKVLASEAGEGVKPTEIGAIDGGKQELVQRKLREVAELIRVSLGKKKKLTEAEEKWFNNYVNDGLCLGFVKMLERYPEWMINMWEAMRTWHPLHGVSAVHVINDLNEHIQKVVPFDKDGVAQNFLEASLMATESYRLMDDDGGSQYGDTPDYLKQVKVSATPAVTVTVGEELIVDSSTDEPDVRWANVLKRILALATKEGVDYHCIVYSDVHEMAVRFTGPAAKVTAILLSETEDVGIVTKSSWEGIKPLVSKWLGGDQDGYGVEVKEQKETYK